MYSPLSCTRKTNNVIPAVNRGTYGNMERFCLRTSMRCAHNTCPVHDNLSTGLVTNQNADISLGNDVLHTTSLLEK